MQSLNKKEGKLLEFQITQTMHPKSVADRQTTEVLMKRFLLGIFIEKFWKLVSTDGETDGVDPLLDLLLLKRRR